MMSNPLHPGQTLAYLQATARFIAEFAREPDEFLGLLYLNFSMGQWLSLPMIACGLIGFLYFGRRKAKSAEVDV